MEVSVEMTLKNIEAREECESRCEEGVYGDVRTGNLEYAGARSMCGVNEIDKLRNEEIQRRISSRHIVCV